MICQAIESLEALKTADFSHDSFNFLVKHPNKPVAEVVRIPQEFGQTLRSDMEVFAVDVNHTRVRTFESMVHCAWEHMHVSFSKVFQFLQTPAPELSPEAVPALCRMTATVLDLSLVSYVVSHGSRFDLNHLQKDMPIITVQGLDSNGLHVNCTLRRLACLHNFLDRNLVWTFQGYSPKELQIGQPMTESSGLYILSRIEDFADI
ncbi:uncharacterized protein PV06_02100 [Exophiala oligosperma]|uniref:Uncharacterized protein n=1 Tax=Exophiala oligosperma TaxID=215243 RepID=A0A0D2DTI2_9EURO|nr:uncharacterized protein PV06_02100 [Exophiala oligosperma]KIW46428.1 hypothetical protein PV06_02100 [Exophiala oligosperma]